MTAYPEILRQWCEFKGYKQPEIKQYQGKIEGLWMLFQNYFAVCDILSTGATLEENGLQVLETIMEVQLVLYRSEQKMQIKDRKRLNNLMSQLNSTAKKKEAE